MGNSLTASTNQPNSLDVISLMTLLANKDAPVGQKRAAFERLQQEFAPQTHQTKAYSDELSRVFALRFDPWEQRPQDASTLSEVDLADRIRGCIFGAALGDAIGLCTEFMTQSQVEENYPPDFEFFPGCDVHPDSHRMMFPKGDWTDDTDQMILILQSLLQTGGRCNDQGSDFASQLVTWKDSGFSGLGDSGGAGLGQTTKKIILTDGFINEPCTAARKVWEQSGKSLAPNGAVMRTAVTGVPFFWDSVIVDENTLAYCRVTHADPRCAASCVAISHCVSLLLRGIDDVNRILSDALPHAEKHLNSHECIDEFHRFASVSSLEQLELDEPHSIGYTFKCMGSGLWALRVVGDLGFSETLQQIVRAGGDADTNGVVAGALAGARLGYSRLPAAWLTGLPYALWLEAWVQKVLFMLNLPVKAKE
mmetsp:Transcript_15502/g.20613  ORF Transcript_15502/g.20613 Transcript_15502/m.20613 type:complete len:422 (-) Transcript_15502:176-1441(-)